ncbi:putative aldouronate transport system substrate-binding protein [Butyrivibrio fibrisolvens]|uniref:Putative aldouronate transport system substrate-binding protein n=1 Tax=Butyrivibrio fibrisolvens TaxID=831 RepID=A0A1H9V371_BUTFI|nr:extracellular solute-binding protein [Butyrivibrio fibrisolvens]SES16186.1 putative aldouronate transport system substrate-binding protein [Butyrivibrio fibrisolvens]
MRKKIVALFLTAMTTVAAITGCSKDAGQAGGSTSSADYAYNEDGEWTWPLKEKKELSIWIVWSNDYVENPNDLKAIQKMEELTNVHINWQVVDAASAQEQFGLMLASGEYPDIIRDCGTYYPGGTEKGVQDGVLVDLTDVAEKYMPNYTALRTSIPELEKDTVTDEGKIVGTRTITSYFGDIRGERVWAGMALRGDWLDELGLEVPRTIDDWDKVLTAFKENYPECEAPLMIGTNGYDYFSHFLSAYGVLGEFYKDGDTVKYGPLEDGYKQWLTLFHDWYERGLIDPNFMTNSADMASPADYIGTGKAGAGVQLWGLTSDVLKTQGYTTDEDFNLVATSSPVLKEGDTPEIGFNTSALVKEEVGISTSTKDLELACRYLDFWYSNESMLLNTLGIEGESYTVDADGTYHLTDAMQAMIDEGKVNTRAEAVYTYTLGTADFGLYNWGMFDPIYEGQDALKAYDEFDKDKFDLMLPPCMTMTDAENTEYVTLYTDIQTLARENTVKFITGEKSLDEYEEFVEQLRSYNIDRCIELQQAALDRYNAR